MIDLLMSLRHKKIHFHSTAECRGWLLVRKQTKTLHGRTLVAHITKLWLRCTVVEVPMCSPDKVLRLDEEVSCPFANSLRTIFATWCLLSGKRRSPKASCPLQGLSLSSDFRYRLVIQYVPISFATLCDLRSHVNLPCRVLQHSARTKETRHTVKGFESARDVWVILPAVFRKPRSVQTIASHTLRDETQVYRSIIVHLTEPDTMSLWQGQVSLRRLGCAAKTQVTSFSHFFLCRSTANPHEEAALRLPAHKLYFALRSKICT